MFSDPHFPTRERVIRDRKLNSFAQKVHAARIFLAKGMRGKGCFLALDFALTQAATTATLLFD